MGVAVEQHLAALRLADAGNRFEKLRLAVAGNARDANDLAAAHVEGDIVDDRDAARIHHREVAHRQLDCLGFWPRPCRPAAAPGDRPSVRPVPPPWFRSSCGSPPSRPWRITETLSVIAMISRSLWVISTTVFPWSLSWAKDAGRGDRLPTASGRRSARQGSGFRRRDTAP